MWTVPIKNPNADGVKVIVKKKALVGYDFVRKLRNLVSVQLPWLAAAVCIQPFEFDVSYPENPISFVMGASLPIQDRQRLFSLPLPTLFFPLNLLLIHL